MTTREIGELGEKKGVEYLKKAGYKIVETNFSVKAGEIDVIAKDKDYLVFVEIKFRRTSEYGPPAEAVVKKKQNKIIKSALLYLKMNRIIGANVRFDVLSLGPGENDVELIKNAFMSTNKYTY
jgi:putative endonuclease